jgi:hypothetical protein
MGGEKNRSCCYGYVKKCKEKQRRNLCEWTPVKWVFSLLFSPFSTPSSSSACFLSRIAPSFAGFVLLVQMGFSAAQCLFILAVGNSSSSGES